MGGFRRGLMVVLGLAVAGQAAWLCLATGGRALTRFASAEVAMGSNPGDLSSLFEGTGLNEKAGEMGAVRNEFTFGWLPSPTLGPEALSVLTVGGPGLLVALLALVPSRRHRR
jgi:hypothetical protein